MLMNPVFADYMQAYGEGGLKALRPRAPEHLARLYWYTVEFGLIATHEGLRIYGSGILSSAGESVYCLEDPRPQSAALRSAARHADALPHRRFQETYFVIDDFEQLFDATRPDFAPIYREIAVLPDIEPDDDACRTTADMPTARRRKKMGRSERGPSLGRKRLEDVRQNHKGDPYRTAQFRDRPGKSSPFSENPWQA